MVHYLLSYPEINARLMVFIKELIAQCGMFISKIRKTTGKNRKQTVKRIGLFLFPAFLVFFASSCGEWGSRPFYQADISDISIDSAEIRQYEKVLFNANPFVLRQEIEPYINDFYFFFGDAIDEEEVQQQLYDYVTDPLMIELYLDSREKWEDMSDLRASLTEAFRYYAYHFPEESTPLVYTYISGIDYTMPVYYSEGNVVIALDTYLGSDYPLYSRLGIPAYQSRWMIPAQARADVMRTLANKHIARLSSPPETLLEHMIHEGKQLHFLDCMMPGMHDTLKIKYTADQHRWMKQYAGYAWTYKIDNDLLYSTDHSAIIKFVREAPFTSTFSRESAPRTGAWLGWQIVREYMRRNPDVTLKDLFKEDDARKILRDSRYRPG